MVDPKFDCYAHMIKVQRDKNIPWERIDFLAAPNEPPTDATLESHISIFVDFQGLPAITCAEWHSLVADRKAAEESGASTDDGGLFVDFEPNNEQLLSERTVSPQSCWQQYRAKLREEKHFTRDAVDRLEDECRWIVNRIRLNTKDMPTSIKGLVVGNVQSGKTANMAGVIAMAADIGFNFFVVLAGRVTNLRQQTSNRLYDDVRSEPGIGGLEWQSFAEMLKPNIQHRRLQDFSWTEFDGGAPNRNRYLTVCLKEPNWLKNLIRWLQADSTCSWVNTGRVKMLIIDDECDQASVNTRDVETDLQTTIFRHILGLCNHNMTAQGGKLTEGHEYAAVNYLGYTATPYANLLNDADPRKSLYPRDFIKPLKASPSYWGPSQIFGTLNPSAQSEFKDRPFLCEIPKTDIDRVREIHSGDASEAPQTLKDSLRWFVCASAVRRLSGTKSPVSMLVHTSNAVNDHENMAKAVARYLKELRDRLQSKAGSLQLLQEFEELYSEQCKQLSLETFNEVYIEYQPKEGDVVKDYPEFNKIASHILSILKKEPSQIQIAQDATGQIGYEFSDAIHLCIDNSDNDANIDDGAGHLTTMRIHYPTKEDPPPPCAPLFIVVGGNTLARGLTLEGLVSSYFLRTVRTCDSLMQMGRWFGYRFGYELLPRIWMTEDCVVKFAHLTRADLDLRQRLEEAVALDKKPADFQPCMIDTSEAIRGFTVTSKNKMQMEEVAEADFSCQTKMPYWFATDDDALTANALAAASVVEQLAALTPSTNASGVNYYYNEGVPYSIVEKFLKDYRFCPKTRDFSDRVALLDYLSKRLSDRSWTVVLSGGIQGQKFEINARSYSNITERACPPGTIAFRHVTEPSDFIADINPEVDFPQIRKPSKTQAKAYRCAATVHGKDKTPVLVLTRFDAKNINKLNKGAYSLSHDIYGFALFLPSVSEGTMTAYTKLRCRNLRSEDIEPESEV